MTMKLWIRNGCQPSGRYQRVGRHHTTELRDYHQCRTCPSGRFLLLFGGVIKTKGELYDYMRRTKGKIFINQDNQYLTDIAKGIEQVTYGSDETAFAWGCVVSSNPYLTFEWKQQGKIHTVETHLIGSYNLDNVLAAVAVGRFFKIPAERISRAIAAYEPTNNRSQLKKTENNELIIVLTTQIRAD